MRISLEMRICAVDMLVWEHIFGVDSESEVVLEEESVLVGLKIIYTRIIEN